MTLNTDYLDHDELQLSTFLHEEAHWFVGRVVPPRPSEEGEEVAIIRELRQMYPNSPVSAYSAYLHLIVAWVELDAMAELVGEEAARRLLREKVERVADDPLLEVDQLYRWYDMRVLEDTEAIGANSTTASGIRRRPDIDGSVASNPRSQGAWSGNHRSRAAALDADSRSSRTPSSCTRVAAAGAAST